MSPYSLEEIHDFEPVIRRPYADTHSIYPPDIDEPDLPELPPLTPAEITECCGYLDDSIREILSGRVDELIGEGVRKAMRRAFKEALA